MTTRVERHQHRAMPTQRSHSNNNYWTQYPSLPRDTAINEGQTFYDPSTVRNLAEIRASQSDFSHLDFSDPYRLPPAPEGCKPPAAWEEWERNACWPFPANMPKELQQIRTVEDVQREAAAKAVQQEEAERNKFWPFPNPLHRRTSSHVGPQLRPVSRTRTRERTESNPTPPAPQPRSILKKKSGERTASYANPLASMFRARSREGVATNTAYEPVQRPKSILRTRSGERQSSNNVPLTPRAQIPARSTSRERVDFGSSSQPAPRPRTLSGSQRREHGAALNAPNARSAPSNAPVIPEGPLDYRAEMAPILNSCMTIISPLLAQDSVGLIHFDLRLPHTSAKKLVHNHHWTHLNREDIKQPACLPSRTHMRIYTHITGSDWIADVRPSSRDYVTVEDVLVCIYETFSVPIDAVRWARDGINPTLKSRVYRAYNRRVEKVKSVRASEYSKAKKAGLLRVDYLGSKYLFAGLKLCYGGGESEWWQMQVTAE
ncbi:hypothetical protein ACEPAI_10044 [Sanghuangporus weigelae]